MSAILLPLGLAFIMFAIGLGLRVADFTRIARYPRSLGTALVNQIILLPLWAAALVMGYQGRPEFALGIMVLAACPGGVTSNLLTVLAGGNAALSVSATAISSLVGIISIPLILWAAQAMLLGDAALVAVPAGRIVLGVFLVTGVPLVLGMVLHYLWPTLAVRIRRWCRHLATAIFALIVIGAFMSQRETMMMHFTDLGPYIMALNVGTMALGWFSARLLQLDFADMIAVTMESGMQNAALAIFIATSLFGEPAMVVPAILYALMMNVSAAAFTAWARAKGRTVSPVLS